MSNTIEITDERLLEIASSLKNYKSNHTTPWMKVREVSSYLKLGETKVRELINKGTIPHKRIDGSIRVHKKMLDMSIYLGKNIEVERTSEKEIEEAKSILE